MAIRPRAWVRTAALTGKVVHLSFGMAETMTLCALAGVEFVRLRNLPNGATSVECSTDEGADELRSQLRDHVLPTQRTGSQRERS